MEFNCEENRQLWRRLYRKALLKWNTHWEMSDEKKEENIIEITNEQERVRDGVSGISLENLLGLDKEAWVEYIKNNIKANERANKEEEEL